MNQDFLFVRLLYTERSGSNLFRKLFLEHFSDAVAPSPPHFLKHLVPAYGAQNHSDLRFFNSVYDDALKLALIHFSPWEHFPSREQVIECLSCFCGDNNFNVIDIVSSIQRCYAANNNASIYFDKDNSLCTYGELLATSPYGKTLFIKLIRDPRDILLSEIERPINRLPFTSFYSAVGRICGELDEIKRLNCHFSVTVYYEDLLDSASCCFERVSPRIRSLLPAHPGKPMQTATQILHSGLSHEWKNLDKPIIKSNSRKYLSASRHHQLLAGYIELLLGRDLFVLGYKREFIAARPIAWLRLSRIILFYVYAFIFSMWFPIWSRNRVIKASIDGDTEWRSIRSKALKDIGTSS